MSVRLFLVVFFAAAVPINAAAFPWDVDMFRQQSLKTNEIARAPAEGTVPRGFKPFKMTPEEAAEKLTNPKEPDFNSLWRGRRVWKANCSVCHGADGKGETVVGPQIAAPNLLEDFYKNNRDGKVYAVIKLGGANMPRYGFKLREADHWHVINYLRFLQGKVQVEGFPKPE